MSEPIPESIPTSADPRSRRPAKKARTAATPQGLQSQALTALFEKQPLDREIYIPTSATPAPRTSASLAPPPEIVANVQGSSAGAGSGEFHVYKASRRREYERVRLMDEESRREELNREWKEKVEAERKRDEEKTSKNAKRRGKAKARKAGLKGRDGNGDGDGKAAGGEGKMAVDKVDLAAGRPMDLGTDGAADEIATEPVVEGNGIIIHDED